jgi:RNA polymerase sigma-70 factor, ECF subfamily
MADRGPGDITSLLIDWGNGDRDALDRLIPLLYPEFRRLARRHMRRERAGHSLHTTALVHEAYLRLVDYTRVKPESRLHFFAIAAQAMRRILVERARRGRTARRGSGAPHVPLADEAAGADTRAAHLLALDEALARLAQLDARKAQVVELKYFGGLTIDETAAVVGISTPTVEREWRAARLWLYQELRPEANR